MVRDTVAALSRAAARDLSDGRLKCGKVLQGKAWSQGALMRACRTENDEYVRTRYHARGSDVPASCRGPAAERQLGVGHFATATRCYDQQLRRPVAVKETCDHAYLAMSAQDARLLQRMGPSRCIAELLDFVLVKHVHPDATASRSAVTVLELFGCDALKVFARGHVMGDAGTRQVIRDWAEGIAHVHASGRPHGDIKDDNVLVDEHLGRGKVIDPLPCDDVQAWHYAADVQGLVQLAEKLLRAGNLLSPGAPGRAFIDDLHAAGLSLTLGELRAHAYLAEGTQLR